MKPDLTGSRCDREVSGKVCRSLFRVIRFLRFKPAETSRRFTSEPNIRGRAARESGIVGSARKDGGNDDSFPD